MEWDEENELNPASSRQYTTLRTDLCNALAAFDRAQDWADLIHDLQRVIRVFGKHSNSTFVPEKALLAKRLAQCLTSFLPSGVHLKALETYETVFSRIGPSRLARDLPLYAGGLFPLFSHCSTTLKAPLLSIYETFFLPLGPALCPLLDGIVLAILPGLEDESSDFYSRSYTLLENVSKAVIDVGIFARALWRALLVSPSTRLAAAQYLKSKLSSDNIELRSHMVSDMPLVAYAIAAALSDEKALTQRSVLDLLMSELALDSEFFDCTSPEEHDAAVSVMGGVFGALIKRDLSLTKRVHAWLLGGLDGDTGENFCNKHSKDLVLSALDVEINLSLQQSKDSHKATAKPCKIATALLDRDELSECLGNIFALRMLWFGMRGCKKPEVENEHDIRRMIGDLLQDIGSARVFGELEKMLAQGSEKVQEDFELLTFALSIFPNQNDFVRRKHLPGLLREVVNSFNIVSTNAKTLDKAVSFCRGAVLSMAMVPSIKDNTIWESDINSTVAAFASFFVAWLAHAVEQAPAEVYRSYSDVTVADENSAEVRMSSMFESRREYVSLAKGACAFFVAIASSELGNAETVRLALQATAKCASAADIRISLAGSRAFAQVAAYMDRDELDSQESKEQVLRVIRRCWRQMHPSMRTATPQSAQSLLGLQQRFPKQTKNVLADGILSTDLSRRLRNLERFACLWRLGVEHRLLPLPADDSLFLMLDALTDEDWGPKMLARSWLSDALEVDPSSVLDAPLRLLITPESRTVGVLHQFKSLYDAPRALYGFQVIRAILESCLSTKSGSQDSSNTLFTSPESYKKNDKRGRTGIRALALCSPSPRTVQAIADAFAIRSTQYGESGTHSSQNIGEEGPVSLCSLLPAKSYIAAVAIVCLGYIRGTISVRHDVLHSSEQSPPVSANTVPFNDHKGFGDLEWIFAGLGTKSFEELHAAVCAAAAECLATLFTSVPLPSPLSAAMANSFSKPVLTLVRRHISNHDPVRELHFIDVMTFLVTAEGPCYLSSMYGKEAFTKSDTGDVRLSFSESQLQLGSGRPSSTSGAPQPGAIESLPEFVPWMLDSVAQTCRASGRDPENGSQEVLGVRRRWIRFMEASMRYMGVCLPIIAEGLLLILQEFLHVQNEALIEDTFPADCEFSRVDETLVLLEGIRVVSSNVLWSFEHALSNRDLNDGISKTQVVDSSRALRPTTIRNDSYSQQDNRSEALSASMDNGNDPSMQDPTGPSSVERSSNVTTASASMMSAINPLRMINDFVKDVFSGSGSDGAHRLLDPRRSAARILFCLLPGLMGNIARVWGPSKEAHLINGSGRARHFRKRETMLSSRLSAELPRERRQAQRSAVLSVLEPIFEIRSTDVIASIIALFVEEQDEVGVIPHGTSSDSDSPAKMSVHMLHALDYATPDVVVSAVKVIYEKANRWDYGNVDAAEGRVQQSFRKEALASIQKLISTSSSSMSEEKLKSIGQNAKGDQFSSLAGGATGLDFTQPVFPSAGHAVGHNTLFHSGDFLARCPSVSVETACLNFLDYFLETCMDGDDVLSSWPTLNILLKEYISSGRRKSNIPALLRVLGTYVSRYPFPFPDSRYKSEIMARAASAIEICGQIASGAADIPKDEQKGVKDFKKRLSIVALRTLTRNVPVLIGSTMLEEKPQVQSSTSSSLLPAITVLRKVAARASAAQNVFGSAPNQKSSSVEKNSALSSADLLETAAAIAATEVVLNIGNRDWGVRHVRREVLSLIEDPNFFHGKRGGVLENISAIIREVVASGGASFLFSSLGKIASNGTPGLPSIFIGRDSESVLRARAIRRLAFCVFVSEPDFYSPQLPTILERIRDALRMSDSLLVTECMMCLRALLLRTGPASVSAFRASILSELFRIALNPTQDTTATLGALKFLDLITLLSPSEYGYETCFFFGEPDLAATACNGPYKPFEPLVLNLRSLWKDDHTDIDKMFAPPLRLTPGYTVLSGSDLPRADEAFIGRYACALSIRNAMPKMRALPVEKAAICKEFEVEFLT